MLTMLTVRVHDDTDASGPLGSADTDRDNGQEMLVHMPVDLE